MSIKSLRAQLLKLRESIPAKKKPFVVIFENADGTMSGDNAARLQAAEAADAHILHVKFMSQAQIYKEQYEGTKHEHLWGTPPTTDEATP
jgi:hypothetical protein